MSSLGELMNINQHAEVDSDKNLQIAYNKVWNIIKLVPIKGYST